MDKESNVITALQLKEESENSTGEDEKRSPNSKSSLSPPKNDLLERPANRLIVDYKRRKVDASPNTGGNLLS